MIGNNACRYIDQCPCKTAVCNLEPYDVNCVRLLLTAYHHKGHHAVNWEDKKEKLEKFLSNPDNLDAEKLLRLFEKLSTDVHVRRVKDETESI